MIDTSNVSIVDGDFVEVKRMRMVGLIPEPHCVAGKITSISEAYSLVHVHYFGGREEWVGREELRKISEEYAMLKALEA